jgi:FixJ family two-component response regulator
MSNGQNPPYATAGRGHPFPLHGHVPAEPGGQAGMSASDHIVFIVDDDERIRAAMSDLLSSLDFNVVTFGAAIEYIDFPRPDLPACLVLDVELPDINGLDLQARMAGGSHPPIVFITGHGDVPSSVRALKAGAMDFLTKPFSVPDLIAAIRASIARDRTIRIERAQLTALRKRFDSLTPREREVLPLVVSGLLNKQAASELGISEITLQIHRSKIMHKMEARSLADLVRMAATLEVPLRAPSIYRK